MHSSSFYQTHDFSHILSKLLDRKQVIIIIPCALFIIIFIPVHKCNFSLQYIFFLLCYFFFICPPIGSFFHLFFVVLFCFFRNGLCILRFFLFLHTPIRRPVPQCNRVRATTKYDDDDEKKIATKKVFLSFVFHFFFVPFFSFNASVGGTTAWCCEC